MSMIDETIKDTEARMKKSVEVLGRDLAGVRTGRVSAALVEHLTVDYYGTVTASQPAGDHRDAGATPDLNSGLGQAGRGQHREGHP